MKLITRILTKANHNRGAGWGGGENTSSYKLKRGSSFQSCRLTKSTSWRSSKVLKYMTGVELLQLPLCVGVDVGVATAMTQRVPLGRNRCKTPPTSAGHGAHESAWGMFEMVTLGSRHMCLAGRSGTLLALPSCWQAAEGSRRMGSSYSGQSPAKRRRGEK